MGQQLVEQVTPEFAEGVRQRVSLTRRGWIGAFQSFFFGDEVAPVMMGRRQYVKIDSSFYRGFVQHVEKGRWQSAQAENAEPVR